MFFREKDPVDLEELQVVHHRKGDLRCSFCNKWQDQVGKLISSPGRGRHLRAYICNECVGICQTILQEEHEEPVKGQAGQAAEASGSGR
jgi:hypothetical protein